MTNSLRPHGYQRTPSPGGGAHSPYAAGRRTRAAGVHSAAPSAPAGQKPKQRDAFFDNAKYLAIVLVAMAHSWEPLTDYSRTRKPVHGRVHLPHAGVHPHLRLLLAQLRHAPDRLKRLVTGVLVPYVLFEAAYTLFKR